VGRALAMSFSFSVDVPVKRNAGHDALLRVMLIVAVVYNMYFVLDCTVVRDDEEKQVGGLIPSDHRPDRPNHSFHLFCSTLNNFLSSRQALSPLYAQKKACPVESTYVLR